MPEGPIEEQLFDSWLVETLRVTAFLDPAAQIDTTDWWSMLVGVPVETITSQPQRMIHVEEGPFASGKMILRIEPTRIDWRFTLPNEPKEEVQGISTIGLFSTALDIFGSFIHRWFELTTCPSMQRLAFGAILLQPMETRQLGYQQLSKYLQHWVKIDHENSSDFVYRINRPRTSASGIPDLIVNRLSTWSVAARGIISFSAQHGNIVSSPPAFACQLELDINTAPQFRGELSRDQLPKIFQELIDLGSEIAKEGDIR